MGFTFMGTSYELEDKQGETLVQAYKAMGLTDPVIAGLLATFKKQVETVTRKSAEQVFGDLKAKVDADPRIKDLLPKVQKTWERYSALSEQLDDLDGQVMGIVLDVARTCGLMKEGVRVGFTAEDHKLTVASAKKGGTGTGVGGSQVGTTKFSRVELKWNGKPYIGLKEDVAKALIAAGMNRSITVKKGDKEYHVNLSVVNDVVYYSKWLDQLGHYGIVEILRKFNKEEPAA